MHFNTNKLLTVTIVLVSRHVLACTFYLFLSNPRISHNITNKKYMRNVSTDAVQTQKGKKVEYFFTFSSESSNDMCLPVLCLLNCIYEHLQRAPGQYSH